MSKTKHYKNISLQNNNPRARKVYRMIGGCLEHFQMKTPGTFSNGGLKTRLINKSAGNIKQPGIFLPNCLENTTNSFLIIKNPSPYVSTSPVASFV